MPDVDQLIREGLDHLAAPDVGDPRPAWDRLVARRRRRRARRSIGLATAAIVVAGGIATASVALDGAPGDSDREVATDATLDTPPVDGPEVTSPGAMSCVSTYSPATLAERSFAFDGTVRETRFVPAASEEELEVTLAVFEVHSWYAGGDGATATVQMQRPVAVGERLLVSGEPRWGGAPLDDAIAWECGFTVAHSADLAAEWASALGGE